MKNMVPGRPEVSLIFAPFAAIPEHALLDFQIAEKLGSVAEERVFLISCNSILNNMCVAMAAHGLDGDSSAEQKQLVCSKCASSSILIGKLEGTPLERLPLESFIDSESQKWVDQTFRRFSALPIEEMFLDGVQVGRRWSYDLILSQKKYAPEDPTFRRLFDKNLRSCLFAYRAGRNLAINYSVKSALTYNFQYSINRAFLQGVDSLCQISYSYHFVGPPNIRRFEVVKANEFYRPSRDRHRKELLTQPTRASIGELSPFLDEWINSRSVWAYSPPRSRQTPNQIRLKLGLSSSRKTWVVLGNSPDEVLAETVAALRPAQISEAEDFVFLRGIIELAKTRPQEDFVFRLHPRLFPNRREQVSSNDLKTYFEILANRPPNLVLNHPSDNLSIYDLVLVCDGAINYRSSSGLEFLAIGIGVISVGGSALQAYPSELGLVCDLQDKASLVKALDSLISNPWDFSRSLLALRWLGARYFANTHYSPDRLEREWLPNSDVLTKLSNQIAGGVETIRKPSPGIARLARFLYQVQIKNAGRNPKLDSQTTQPLWQAQDFANSDEFLESILANRPIARVRPSFAEEELVSSWLQMATNLIGGLSEDHASPPYRRLIEYVRQARPSKP